MNDSLRPTVLIASYLEPVHVERIRAVDARLDVVYEPALLRPPRYAADHVGAPGARSVEDEVRWRALLARADVLFDFDYTNDAELPELCPRVRWIQATSAGIGAFVKRRRYDERMPRTIFTTASGVHARPLAEFCALAMLAFSRGLFIMLEAQRLRHWERFAGTDLLGKTVVIYGHGSIGEEVARVSRSFGMQTIGVKRSVAGQDPGALQVDELHAASGLGAVLPRADFLVLAAPHTPETEGAIGRRELALLPRGAVLVNVGRGALVDEAALVEALRSGHLGGAALDVFQEEPLPATSPLWAMPNVLVSPHSASTSDRENTRLTDLFCRNLSRFLAGEALENVLDTNRLY
ncbi:MAG TPA: D-2-hydroxyacid dehydrogenase [Vicinamibacteria bacterium]|nr:D-2-hydroxyacid dehydrogenase [Vicinamibacteria bacterium]